MADTDYIEKFHSDGFVCIPRVLTEADVSPVRAEFAELLRMRAADWARRGYISTNAVSRLEGTFDTDLLYLRDEPGFDAELLGELDITLPHAPFASIQPDSAFHVGPALLSLVSNQRLLDVIEQFIGPEITSSGNQHIRLKLPDARSKHDQVGRSAATPGAATPWHTDAYTMADESADTPILTAWIPMHAVGLDDGCLIAVPGSHTTPDSVLWPVASDTKSSLDKSAVKIPAPFGSVVLLNKHVAHASAPNRSNRLRWSFDLRYLPTSMPRDRPWFPSIVVRSPSAPSTIENCGASWKRKWEQARSALAASGQPLPGRPEYARAVAESYLRRWGDGAYYRWQSPFDDQR